MSTFVLIDHSLKRPGGHHFDYATQILQAADAAGFRIVLATHRRFRDRQDMPDHWRVIPVFDFTTYTPYTVFRSEGGPLQTHMLNKTATSLIGRWKSWRWHRGRQQCIRSFSKGCRRLFKQIELTPGDHVFLHTMSEVDLAGLADFLRDSPQTVVADWHLQFHFNILNGREPDYDGQADELEPLCREFDRAMLGLGQHRLHFYNTTTQLTSQYNRLGCVPFQRLPYPVNRAFADEKAIAPATRPEVLRVACGGALRAEKNHASLNGLLRELWDEHFSRGTMQLLVQSNKKRFQLAVPPVTLPSPPGGECGVRGDRDRVADPVAYVPHPLSADEYVRFIRGAGVGVFYYDAERYYARHAGILGEFLAAGVPVIVPAGCWLAEQIAESIHIHHASLLTQANICATCEANPADSVEILEAASDVILTFDWLAPATAGNYLEVQFTQFDNAGKQLDCYSSIVGHRSDQRTLSVVVHIAEDARQLRLGFRNAFHQRPVQVENARVHFLGQPEGIKHWPAGAVGLVAASPAQTPRLLCDISEHYVHYRRTALEFSRHWMREHDPAGTLRRILACSKPDKEEKAA